MSIQTIITCNICNKTFDIVEYTAEGGFGLVFPPEGKDFTFGNPSDTDTHICDSCALTLHYLLKIAFRGGQNG